MKYVKPEMILETFEFEEVITESPWLDENEKPGTGIEEGEKIPFM